MKKRISIDEIEEIIKNKLKQSGVFDVVGNEKISEIKNKIKEILENGKKLDEQEAESANVEKTPVVSNPTIQTKNPNVTIKTTQDPEKTEVIEKDTELKLKEKELIKKEIELEQREKELKEKEEESRYKPELPEILKSIKPGEIVVFDENELSLGMENLTNRKFRLKSNPDEKKSLNDLWLLDGITMTDVYKIELKKIGELNFNPYDGTSSFTNSTQDLEVQNLQDDFEQNHDVEMAVNSQVPKEEMLDSVEPIKDVTQPLFNVDDIEKQKFENNFKDVISKIVNDELNKINSQTTKQNIYSL